MVSHPRRQQLRRVKRAAARGTAALVALGAAALIAGLG